MRHHAYSRHGRPPDVICGYIPCQTKAPCVPCQKVGRFSLSLCFFSSHQSPSRRRFLCCGVASDVTPPPGGAGLCRSAVPSLATAVCTIRCGGDPPPTYHLRTITVPPPYQHQHHAIAPPSPCHHRAITVPPPYHHRTTTVPVPAPCHRPTITVPSPCHHRAITVPSSYHRRGRTAVGPLLTNWVTLAVLPR